MEKLKLTPKQKRLTPSAFYAPQKSQKKHNKKKSKPKTIEMTQGKRTGYDSNKNSQPNKLCPKRQVHQYDAPHLRKSCKRNLYNFWYLSPQHQCAQRKRLRQKKTTKDIRLCTLNRCNLFRNSFLYSWIIDT